MRPTLAEELANCLTHGVGAALAIAGLTLLVVLASLRGTAWHVVGCSIFGATLVLMYLASTLYHSIPHRSARRVLQACDHSAIFLLIAGSYTPFVLVNLRGAWGWSLFGVVWGLAVLGVIAEVTPLGRREWLRVSLCALMGWLVVIACRPLILAIPTGGLLLIFFGGVAYTVGIAFYLWRSLPFHHAIWHVCVLAGSALHFGAVWWYVLP